MAVVTLLQKWQLLQAIIADQELSPSAKLVAARLLYHHSAQTGRCSPSYQTLAEGAALTRRSVIAGVRELEERSWLSVHRVKGGDPTAARGFVTNGFTIAFGRQPGLPLEGGGVKKTTLPPGEENDTGGSERNDTPGVKETTLGGVNKTTLNSGKDTGKGNREESPPTPSPFDEWWQAYPRRDGKIAARKAFDRVLKKRSATVDELIAGARRYAEARAGDDPKFTKVPTTWLNGGHWADEPVRGRNPGSAANSTIKPNSATAYLMERRARRMNHG